MASEVPVIAPMVPIVPAVPIIALPSRREGPSWRDPGPALAIEPSALVFSEAGLHAERVPASAAVASKNNTRSVFTAPLHF